MAKAYPRASCLVVFHPLCPVAPSRIPHPVLQKSLSLCWDLRPWESYFKSLVFCCPALSQLQNHPKPSGTQKNPKKSTGFHKSANGRWVPVPPSPKNLLKWRYSLPKKLPVGFDPPNGSLSKWKKNSQKSYQ